MAKGDTVDEMVTAVLEADKPLTTTGVADRAGVSDQTVRNYLDEFKEDGRVEYGQVGRGVAFWPAGAYDDGEAARRDPVEEAHRWVRAAYAKASDAIAPAATLSLAFWVVALALSGSDTATEMALATGLIALAAAVVMFTAVVFGLLAGTLSFRDVVPWGGNRRGKSDSGGGSDDV